MEKPRGDLMKSRMPKIEGPKNIESIRDIWAYMELV